jgi:hypothetical protein
MRKQVKAHKEFKSTAQYDFTQSRLANMNHQQTSEKRKQVSAI